MPERIELKDIPEVIKSRDKHKFSYVLKIEKQDSEHPLINDLILEFGVDANNPKGFLEALIQMTELLKITKTPENLAEFMRKNSYLATIKK